MATDDSAKKRQWTRGLLALTSVITLSAVSIATLGGCAGASPTAAPASASSGPIPALSTSTPNPPAPTVPTEAAPEATLTPTPILPTPRPTPLSWTAPRPMPTLAPTSTRIPTPTPLPTPVLLVPILPQTLIPLPTPILRQTLPPPDLPPPDAPVVPGVPTQPPAPTATPTPSLTIDGLYQTMLGLINEARADQGLSPVVLGDNPAAQAHAEDMLENCYSDHWNLEGIGPGTRYSFAGGYQANTETINGSSFCREDVLEVGPNERVQRHMNGWMGSPAHRDAILDPAYRKVNIGLAWTAHQMQSVLQLEGDYIKYLVLPTIEKDGILTMEGSLYNGAGFYGTTDLSVAIHYKPLPTPLTVGQLARIYGGGPGLRAAQLRVPAAPGNHYPTHERVRVREYRRLPHDISPDLPAPRSSGESHDLWLEAKLAPKKEIEVTTYLVTASEWGVDTGTGEFRVVADVSKVLEHYGPGVYSVAVFGLIDGEQDIVSEYSILWEDS